MPSNSTHMKNYSEINNSVADLENTKTHFQLLGCIFYTQLLKQLEAEMGIPSTHLIKYEHNDHDRTDSLGDCVGIEDIYAVAKIGIMFQDSLTHLILFKSHKVGLQKLALNVECRSEHSNFEFDVVDDEQISQINFEQVINFITLSLDKYYTQWTSKFNIMQE